MSGHFDTIYAAVYLFMNCVTIPFASWFRSLYLHTPLRGMAPLAWGRSLAST